MQMLVFPSRDPLYIEEVAKTPEWIAIFYPREIVQDFGRLVRVDITEERLAEILVAYPYLLWQKTSHLLMPPNRSKRKNVIIRFRAPHTASSQLWELWCQVRQKWRYTIGKVQECGDLKKF